MRISDWNSDVCSSDLPWRQPYTKRSSFTAGESGLVAQADEDPLARQAAVPIADVQQTGQAAHQAGLEVVQRPIGVSDLPQHFHHLDALLRRERILDLAGEAEYLDRLLDLLIGRLQQRAHLRRAEAEAALDHLANLGALPGAELGVHIDRKSTRLNSSH